MIRPVVLFALCSTTGFATLAQGADSIKVPETAYRMEQCLNAALAAKAGKVKALEMELNNQVPVYEFTIELSGKGEWEVTCNAMTGKVIAIEEDVEETSVVTTQHEDMIKAAFEKLAVVSEDQARAIARLAHPGEVGEVDRKLTAAQVPVFEFEITMADGAEREVQVDALSGLIIGVEEEIYAIGDD